MLKFPKIREISDGKDSDTNLQYLDFTTESEDYHTISNLIQIYDEYLRTVKGASRVMKSYEIFLRIVRKEYMIKQFNILKQYDYL